MYSDQPRFSRPAYAEDRIAHELAAIESEHRVRILYACESGSRAWGGALADSDYDVRFLDVHPLDWYVSVDTRRDVIERPITDDLDLNCWELRKALRLLRNRNGSLGTPLRPDGRTAVPTPSPAPGRGSPRRRTGSEAGTARLCLPQALERGGEAGRIKGSLCRATPALGPASLTLPGTQFTYSKFKRGFSFERSGDHA